MKKTVAIWESRCCPLPLLFSIVVVLVLSGCTTTKAQFTAYKLPLINNQVDRPGAERCYRECQAARLGGAEAYVQCLGTCPGIEVLEDRACAKGEVPPVAECYTATKMIEEDDWVSTFTAVGITGVGIVVGVLVVLWILSQ